MYGYRRKHYSQNFLHSRKLVSYLLGKSSIGRDDLVLEIGPGKGIITEQLVERSKHVTAVEIDKQWYGYLQRKFAEYKNLTLIHQDFLTFRLPKTSYKVFANIPFSIQGKILRRLLESVNPPEDCYLIVMKEPAYRWAAPYRENMFSIMNKPWFTFTIIHHFRRTDFIPIPNVAAVMLRIQRRSDPLLPWRKRRQFQTFVEALYRNGRPVYQNMKSTYGSSRTARAFRKLNIHKQTRPGSLTLEEWLMLFRCCKGDFNTQEDE